MKINDKRKYPNVIYTPNHRLAELEQNLSRGASGFSEVDGPFSLVALMGNEARILRNAPGIPLYVYPSGDEVLVANTIKDLSGLKGFNYNNTRTVPSSHILTVTEEGTHLHRYRDELPDTDLDLQPEEIAKILREELHKAISSMAGNDRQKKTAVLLSGGIDSSAVAALLRERTEGIVAYTLDFGGNDLENAEYVARQLGIPLRKVAVDQNELARNLRTFILSAEEYRPFVVDNVPGFWFLARAASEDGIEIVYTGSGANELFGDYSPGADYDIPLEKNAKRSQRKELIQGRSPKDPVYNKVLGSGLDRYGFIKPLMDFGVQSREPWGAFNVARFGIQIPYGTLIEKREGKIRHRKPDIARRAFPEIGIYPEKERMTDGSGLSKAFSTDYMQNRKIWEEFVGVKVRRHNLYMDALTSKS